MTMDRVDHKPHLSLLHFRTLAGPLSSTFEMMTSHGFWETGHYSDRTLFNPREQKVEMTTDRVDYTPHLSLLSLSHISWTFIFNFRNDDFPRKLGNRHYSDKTLFNSRKQKVEMTKDRVDHKPHLSFLSLSHVRWTFIFIFNLRNDDLPRILRTGHYSDKTLPNSREQGNNGL